LIFERLFDPLAKLCARLFEAFCESAELLDPGAVSRKTLVHALGPADECALIIVYLVSVGAVDSEADLNHGILIALLFLLKAEHD